MIRFEEYVSYDFIFERVDSIGVDTIDSLQQHIISHPDLTRTERPNISLCSIQNWRKTLKHSFHDFEIDERVIEKFLDMLDEFFAGANLLSGMQVNSDLHLGVLQFEYLFSTEDDSHYWLVMYLND